MRLWSLHPKYLDAKGLVALWRETLLAKHVLEGRTRGYKQHPQLQRFKACEDPLHAINYYLSGIHKEALSRGYQFDESKFTYCTKPAAIKVASGQLKYETKHLLNKLQLRDPEQYEQVAIITEFEPHPLFHVIEGGIESWEVLETKGKLTGAKQVKGKVLNATSKKAVVS